MRPPGPSSSSQTSPKPQQSPSPSPSLLACTSDGAASADWVGAPNQTAAPITAVMVNDDTVVFTFTKGTREYEVTPQSTAVFNVQSGRGGTVMLQGFACIQIIMRGFRGDMKNLNGPADVMANGSRLLEFAYLADFEGVVQWGAGLNAPSCADVTESSSTLTFRFIAQP